MKMKTGMWIYFFALLSTILLCSACLWAAEDVARDVFGHKTFPKLTEWIFTARAWLPLIAAPWLIAAIILSKRGESEGYYTYGAASLLGIVVIAGISALSALLPWMVVVPVL